MSLDSLLGIPAGTDRTVIVKRSLVVLLIYGVVILLSRFWLGLVTKYVPEPYLDEVFHIPQAQVYCRGDFGIWDPKITTPPGLYGVSAILVRLFEGAACTTYKLREISSLSLLLLLFCSSQCLRFIGSRDSAGARMFWFTHSYWNALHAAVNIYLFPPLFFFSGLYYTDVLSTCVVIGAYNYFLETGTSPKTLLGGVLIYVWGLLALFMRQTNIFWVAIFFAGLEWLRACDRISPGSYVKKSEQTWKAWVNRIINLHSRGQIYDPALSDSGVLDFLWCAVSIALAALCNPVALASRIWPYAALLISFAGFVIWNGGVVLGDKSNHVATIHLPQMLYLWPFMMFFSLPLIYPYAISITSSILSIIRKQPGSHDQHQQKTIYQYLSYFGWALAALSASLVIVHYNTIIHPFTLADNRHYVFYAFRYTIRRHPLVKYALTPVYLLSGLLVIQCLAGPFSTSPSRKGDLQPRDSKPGVQSSAARDNQVRTSFALIWVLATALSLVTAPLVEPRYFIIPWVIWRLHVPPLVGLSTLEEQPQQRHGSSKRMKKTQKGEGGRWSQIVRYWTYTGHDPRLWVETAWFLAINIATGYIFLFRGFEWPQEPGRVQRFMW